MAATIEDIQGAVSDLDQINEEIQRLQADRDAKLTLIDVMDNDRALFTELDARDVEAFRAQMLVLADEQVTKSNQEKHLREWVQTIDPNLSMSGWGIDNETNTLFPSFEVIVPKEITDEFVRNINFLARVIDPVQPTRLRVSNRSFKMGYEATFLMITGDKLENAFTVCGSGHSGTSPVKPLLTTLRKISEQAFSSWNNDF